MTLAENIH